MAKPKYEAPTVVPMGELTEALGGQGNTTCVNHGNKATISCNPTGLNVGQGGSCAPTGSIAG
jgi:hypothetical protein